MVCQFACPLSDDVHSKPEVSIITLLLTLVAYPEVCVVTSSICLRQKGLGVESSFLFRKLEFKPCLRGLAWLLDVLNGISCVFLASWFTWAWSNPLAICNKYVYQLPLLEGVRYLPFCGPWITCQFDVFVGCCFGREILETKIGHSYCWV